MKRVAQWELVITVGRHATIKGLSAYATAIELDKLARIGRALMALNTFACNESLEHRTCKACGGTSRFAGSHKPNSCHYARTEAAEKRAVAIGAKLGIVVSTQRDPRGASVKLWADKEDGKALGCFS